MLISILKLAFLFIIIAVTVKFFIIFITTTYLLKKKNIKSNDLFDALNKTSKDYKNKPGEVYKQCSYCSTKVNKEETHCSNCKKAFEAV